MTPRVLIVPAAGLGSRLQSPLPKVLVPVAGVPMLDHLLSRYRGFVARTIVVTNPAALPAVREHVRGLSPNSAVSVLVQAEPTGMLDAILIARQDAAALRPRSVWITWCDQVGVHPATLARLAEITGERPDAALVMPTVTTAEPYIHLERDGSGRIVRVLHRREGDDMPAVGESDMGVFALSGDAFFTALAEYAADVEIGSRTGERNFLPFIPWINRRRRVVTFPSTHPQEAIGVNTPADRAAVETYLRSREP